MSRNFELLQSAGRMIEIAQPEAERQGPSAPDDSGIHPLQLEGAERDETRKLVSRLFLSPGAEAPRCVLFSGTESGTGCSRICASTAAVLAAQGAGSVCVLDANLRSPSLHQQFGVENHYGLTDALRGTERIRKYVSVLLGGKLSLLSSGTTVESWQTLLTSQEMRTRMAELKEEYHFLLVDIPPLNLYTDGIMLARMSNGLILTIKANSSRREVAQKVVEELKSSNVRLLGAILNERRFPIPEALYRHL
jgi:capsular exopolysaccharide synthesis family protein